MSIGVNRALLTLLITAYLSHLRCIWIVMADFRIVVYAWRTSESRMPLARVLKETVASTAISIGVTVFTLLLKLAGVRFGMRMATLKGGCSIR